MLSRTVCRAFLLRPGPSAMQYRLNNTSNHLGALEFDAQLTDGERDQTQQKSFAKLFRESDFTRWANFDNVKVVGKITHRIGNDLYIDFGSKFNAICKVPPKDSEKYILGAKVLLRLYDTELSERFLGSRHDLTLLEADADLIGLYYGDRNKQAPPSKSKQSDDSAPVLPKEV